MKLTDITEIHAETLLAELEMSHRDLQDFLRTALKALHPGDQTYVWPRDIYDDRLVYELSSGDSQTLIQRSFAVVDGEVTFGDPVEVIAVTQYAPVTVDNPPTLSTEAQQELIGDLVPLVEKAVKKDGTIAIKVISPGHGSSGYYSPEVLKRDGPKVFAKGLHVYADHPSVSEETDRPERSVRDLIGAFTTAARWEDEGSAGPGLYADAKLRSDVAPLIEELAPHIGMSIRALGKAETGEIDGKRTRVITAIEQARSCDVVTVPGAGGRVLELFESARAGMSPAPVNTPGQEIDDVDKEVFEEAQRQLEEANRKITDLEAKQQAQEAREAEAAIMREAHAVITETLAGITLPTPTRDRLTTQLAVNPPTKDSALDKDALIAMVQEAAEAETTYLATVTGGKGVQGMGGETAKPEIPTLEETDKRMSAALAAF